MKLMKDRKAFTIVEMVIVIAVIAILATVLVPTISGVIDKANHSADQQFVASLNIQLALWQVDNGQIENESDLREAINSYYGEEGEDFYASLAPKSANRGYHFWFSAADQQVVLAKYEELSGSVAPTAAVEPTFSPASPRSLIINDKNYFLMDRAGSDVTDIMDELESLGGDGQDYLDVINKLIELSNDTNAKDRQLISLINTKISETTIITAGGAHRYADVNNIKYVWISPEASVLQQTLLHIYTDTDVDENNIIDAVNNPLAPETVTAIELPADVNVSLGGLPGIKVDTDNDYAANTKLYVQTDVIAELQKIYATEYVLVTPNGTRYVWVGMDLYPLPLQKDEHGNLTGSVGSADTENLGGADVSFTIECNEGAENVGTGSVYVSGNTIYAAYDKGTVQLTLSGINSSWVDWTSTSAVATVDANGLVTLNLPQVGGVYEATIAATYKYDTSKTASINVCVVRPNEAHISVGVTTDIEVYNDDSKGSIAITYTGNNLEHAIVLNNLVNNDGTSVKIENGVATETNGYVLPTFGTLVVEEDDENALLTVVDNVLNLNKDAINGTKTEDITIKYVDGNNNVFFEKTFTVTVEDMSSTSLEVKNITDTVKIGGSYLFRVGNDGAITLGTLFQPKDATKPVNIGSVTIYDASKTSDGVEKAINSTDDTKFYGKYTSNTDWTKATVEFKNTGVAIIEIKDTKGSVMVRLAVEVVSGKNVTQYSQLGSSGDYVLLNNIELSSGGQYYLSKGTLYGNGFTFDVSNGGTSGSYDSNNYLIGLSNAYLDNVKVVGKVYTSYGTKASDDYVRATVLMSGTSGIYNSYISNSMSAVRVSGGATATIENTVLKGGVFANLELRGGNTILNNVTTINQANANDKTTDNKTVVGAGIAVWYDASSPSLEVKGTLTQWNFISQTDVNNGYIKSYSKNLAEELLKTNGCYVTLDGVKWVNTGIMAATESFTNDNVKGLNGYTMITADLDLGSGAIWTNTGLITKDNITAVPEVYKPTAQKDVLPVISYKNDKISSITGYKEFDSTTGEISITVDMGTATTFNAADLVAFTKYTGVSVDLSTVTVSGSGSSVNGKTVTIPGTSGTYTITYTVDDAHCYKANGERDSSKPREYKLTVLVGYNLGNAQVNVAEPTISQILMVDRKSCSHNKILGFISTCDHDWDYAIPLFDLLTIKDRDDNNQLQNITVNTNISNLTVTYDKSIDGAGWSIMTYNGTYWLVSNGTHNNAPGESVIFTFSYTGVNTKTVSGTVKVNFPSADGDDKSFSTATYVQIKNFTAVSSDALPNVKVG